MMQKFTLLITICLLSTSLLAQDFCGTNEVNPRHEQTLRKFQQNPEEFYRITSRRDLTFIPITVHIVGESDGSGYFTKQNVYREICELNEYYEAMEWHFFIENDIRYINNSSYYNHSSSTTGINMMRTNNVANTFNVYYVNDPAGTCGYFAPTGDAVAIRISCAQGNSSTLAHEAGHYFSLPHTFSGWEGESYDGNNYVSNAEYIEQRPNSFTRYDCTRRGDGFCDTPPDYFSDRWTCGRDDTTVLDPDGVEFNIDGSYIMGYANDNCHSIFSEEQMDAMQVNLTINRLPLARVGVPQPLPVSAVSPISPTAGKTVDISNGAEFSWSEEPNADFYHVFIAEFPAVNNIIQEFTTESTSAIVSGLDVDKNYIWRVKPVMETNTCADYTNPTQFRTALLTGNQNFNQLSIYPNPANFQIEIRNIPDTALLTIFDVSGRAVDMREVQKNQIQIATSDYPEGTYFLKFERNGISKTFPIVILH